MSDDGNRKHGGGPAHGGGHEEAHEGAPEWLISFADNVALMMGFFVVLLAMNMKPHASGELTEAKSPGQNTAANEDMLDWALAVREAFNNPVKPNSTNPNEAELVRHLRRRMSETEASTKDKSQKGPNEKVQTLRPGDYHGMGGIISFERSSATLDATGVEQFRELLKHRKGVRNIIEVRGHVSAAEAFEHDDRGMQLSYDRALAVARALVENGIGWRQIRLIACADNDRVAARTYDQLGHRANQRVEVIETDRTIADEDAATPSSSGESRRPG